jgi:stage V sporulation protein AC
VRFAKCGLIVPITGFAHAMMSAALEYRREGFVTGLGSNMFKLAGSVILFGVVSAYVFGILRIILMGG